MLNNYHCSSISKVFTLHTTPHLSSHIFFHVPWHVEDHSPREINLLNFYFITFTHSLFKKHCVGTSRRHTNRWREQSLCLCALQNFHVGCSSAVILCPSTSWYQQYLMPDQTFQRQTPQNHHVNSYGLFCQQGNCSGTPGNRAGLIFIP